jgi:hypothetical protein
LPHLLEHTPAIYSALLKLPLGSLKTEHHAAPLFLTINLTGQKMKAQITRFGSGIRAIKAGLSAILLAVLPACANYAGIHSDQQTARPQQFETTQSLPSESGHWPAADWADQFGDAQLKTLLEEALKGSPTIAQARARIAGAQAYADTAKASTMPRVDADYSLMRQQLSGTFGRAAALRGHLANPEQRTAERFRTISICGARIAKR